MSYYEVYLAGVDRDVGYLGFFTSRRRARQYIEQYCRVFGGELTIQLTTATPSEIITAESDTRHTHRGTT